MEIPTNNNLKENVNHSNSELISMLSEATEIKNNNANDINITNDLKDFDETIIKEIKQEKAEIKETTEIEKEVKSLISYEESAEMLIGFVDTSQTLILPTLYKKRLFNTKEKEILEDWEKNGVPNEIHNEEVQLYDKYKDIQKLIEDIPFTPKEVLTLKTPLAKCLEKYKFKTSAETTLFGALIIVMLPRIIPLLNGLEKKLQ